MKSIWKRQTIVLGAAVLTAGMWMAPSQDADAGYLTDTWGTVVRNNYGECWQGIWPNPDHAPGCDGAMTFVLSDAADNFDFDSAVLKPKMKEALDGIAEKINAASVSTVTVTGHTDSRGSDAYNQGLSERRAQSAARYLRGKGVEGITTQGMGEKQPVASNDTDEGRAQNRRVVIEAK
jgi:OOP family OmpA-OmpF porin